VAQPLCEHAGILLPYIAQTVQGHLYTLFILIFARCRCEQLSQPGLGGKQVADDGSSGPTQVAIGVAQSLDRNLGNAGGPGTRPSPHTITGKNKGCTPAQRRPGRVEGVFHHLPVAWPRIPNQQRDQAVSGTPPGLPGLIIEKTD
jgi:hypothetical protein